MLTKQKLNRIGEWIKKNGRSLEIARFNYHFENGSREDVLKCLSEYQNDDGGFAHGLEADNWSPYSTPLTSSVALKILYETGFHNNNAIIDKCMGYLANNHFDKKTGTWATILPSNNSFPHAPWWTWQEGGRNTWDFNPSIEIAGFMLYYSSADSVVNNIASQCFKKAEQYLFSENQITDHFHEVYCYLHGILLAKQVGDNVGADIESMEEKIVEYIESTICREPEKWLTSYVAQPIDFMNLINTDDLQILNIYRDEMIKNAQQLIEKLPVDGVWDVTWNWGGNYPEMFHKSCLIWQAVFAIERLLKFRRLGLIE